MTKGRSGCNRKSATRRKTKVDEQVEEDGAGSVHKWKRTL